MSKLKIHPVTSVTLIRSMPVWDGVIADVLSFIYFDGIETAPFVFLFCAIKTVTSIVSRWFAFYWTLSNGGMDLPLVKAQWLINSTNKCFWRASCCRVLQGCCVVKYKGLWHNKWLWGRNVVENGVKIWVELTLQVWKVEILSWPFNSKFHLLLVSHSALITGWNTLKTDHVFIIVHIHNQLYYMVSLSHKS